MKHFSEAKDGNAVIHGFIVDGDGVDPQIVFEEFGYCIEGAVIAGAGDNTWYLPGGIRPIPDKVIGIGRLVVPSAFQQDLDAGDRPGLLPERSDPAKPFFITDVFSIVNDRVLLSPE
jgi:hypothetical protein